MKWRAIVFLKIFLTGNYRILFFFPRTHTSPTTAFPAGIHCPKPPMQFLYKHTQSNGKM